MPVALIHAGAAGAYRQVALSRVGVAGPTDIPVALSHAGVVHHEEINLKVIGTGPLDLVVLCNIKPSQHIQMDVQ